MLKCVFSLILMTGVGQCVAEDWFSENECEHFNKISCFPETGTVDPESDIRQLLKMTTKEGVLNLLAQRKEIHRLNLVQHFYKEHNSQDLIQVLKGKMKESVAESLTKILSDDPFEFMLTDLLHPIRELYAKVFTEAKKQIINPDNIIEIIGTLSIRGLMAVEDEISKTTYNSIFSLIELPVNKKKYSQEARNLWQYLCLGNRYEKDIRKAPYVVSKDVKELLKLRMRPQRGFDEPLLTEILALRNFQHLQKVVKEYESLTLKDKKLRINGLVRKTRIRDLKYSLKNLLMIARGKAYFFAKTLNRELNSRKVDGNRTIWRIIIARFEVDLHQIMYEFKLLNSKSLEDIIENRTKEGYYRETLLTLIKFRKAGNKNMDKEPEPEDDYILVYAADDVAKDKPSTDIRDLEDPKKEIVLYDVEKENLKDNDCAEADAELKR